MTSAKPAVRSWARADLRRRWLGLVVLGLLAGATAGLATSALAGARRSETAYTRLHDAARGAHAIVFATQAGIFDPDWSAIGAMPEVEATGSFALAPVSVDAINGHEVDEDIFLLPPSGGLYVDTEVPVISEGRAPDPTQTDEVWINEAGADELGIGVGDEVTIGSVLDLDAFFGGAPDAEPGPSFAAEIVGIGQVPSGFTWLSGPQVYVSPAILDDHPEIPRLENHFVRLHDGPGDLARLEEVVAASLGPDVPLLDLVEAGDRVTTSTGIERDALVLFALAVLAAGSVIVGQAVVRAVHADAGSSPTLRALGLTRPELARTLSLPFLLPATIAAATSIALAVGLSPRYPIGLARQLEPDPGVHADWLLVVPMAVGAGILLMGLATWTARRVAWARTGDRVRRLTAVERSVQELPLPLPAVIGTRAALITGRGPTALSTRPALIGAVTAVVGVVAAFTLGAGIREAVDDPALVGTTWDAQATTITADANSGISPRQLAAIGRQPTVDQYAVASQTVAPLDGPAIPLTSVRPVSGTWSFPLLAGRAPVDESEVVLGPATADDLDLAVGETLTVGTDPAVALEVVGEALLVQGPHWAYDQGAWLTPEGLLAVQEATAAPPPSETVYLRLGAGDRSGLDQALLDVGLAVEPPERPQSLLHLSYVQSLPYLLAGFLVLLGIGAVGHSLVSAVRRRRHELAVLRSLGLTPLQARASSAWQATCVAVVGVVVGIPVGLVVGRTLWRWIAEATPVYYVAPVALIAVLLVPPVAVITANALAAVPGHLAARLRPAGILHTE